MESVTPETAVADAERPAPKLEFLPSRQFPDWLAEHKLSVAFTTYQAGKLFFVGLQPDRRLSIFERTFNRCMGLCTAGTDTLFMSTLYQLWRFENVLPEGASAAGFDRLYVPRLAWTTGDIDIHDMAPGPDGAPVFVNTLFSCLATVGEGASFYPLWKPPFVSKLAAEDRCHMNGMAMEGARPRYVTAVGRADVADGWREKRMGGGIVVEVATGEIVAEGLSMPHSPRLYQGRLWLLDSGTGWFGHVDPKTGAFERVTFCPGYTRGLAFHGDHAVIGLSRPRNNRTFEGLALEDALAERDIEARAGLLVIDLRTGDIVHWLRMEGVVEELYDVVVLPGVERPMALGFKTDEIRRTLMVGDYLPFEAG